MWIFNPTPCFLQRYLHIKFQENKIKILGVTVLQFFNQNGGRDAINYVNKPKLNCTPIHLYGIMFRKFQFWKVSEKLALHFRYTSADNPTGKNIDFLITTLDNGQCFVIRQSMRSEIIPPVLFEKIFARFHKICIIILVVLKSFKIMLEPFTGMSFESSWCADANFSI